MLVRWRTLIAAGVSVAFAASLSLAAQRIHVVVAGQTPSGIAQRYGIPVADLCAMNQLPTSAKLQVGQKLLIPEPGEVARLQQRKQAPPRTEASPTAVDEPVASADTGTPTEEPEGAPAQAAASSDELQAPEPVEQPDSALVEPVDSSATGTKPAVKAQVTPRAASAPERKAKSPVERQTHVIAQGNTIGKLARRYHLREESLLRANGLRRTDRLKLGQTLVIPSSDDDPIISTGPQLDSAAGSRKAMHEPDRGGMYQLDINGAGPIYYYEPVGPGRHSMRPLLVYLHGRGGDAEQDCRKWAPVARRFGWLVCPSGPVAHNSGRSWNNSWPAGQHAVMGAVRALRERYGRRIQLFGNTLIGFSEGAFVAMNVGVREPKTFNRWLILGADTSYWGGAGLEALQDARGRVRRVVLITGGRDMVVEDTRKVADWLSRARVPIRIQTPETLAHEIALDRMPSLYESALRWLDKGGQPRASAQR